MFGNEGFVEATVDSVHLGTPNKTLQVVLSYIYTGKAKVEMRDALEVLEAADYYELLPLASECVGVIKASVSDSTCHELLQLSRGELESFKEVHAHCVSLMAECFRSIVSSGGMVHMDMDTLTELVSSDDLDTGKEEEVMLHLLFL